MAIFNSYVKLPEGTCVLCMCASTINSLTPLISLTGCVIMQLWSLSVISTYNPIYIMYNPIITSYNW